MGGGARGGPELSRLPLPHVVRDMVNRRKGEPEHPGLCLTRFVQWGPERGDPRRWDFKVIAIRGGREREEDRKRDNLDQAAKTASHAQIASLARAWLARREVWLKPLEQQRLARRFRVRTDWRLTIGLAGASPLETNLVFHHLYGVPMLPGSGVKGLTLAAARLEADQAEYEEALGTQEVAGLVDFLDAVPIPVDRKPLVEVDVMNPHYPRWYREDKENGESVPPGDDQSPVPVFFLTVAPGVEFEFAILCRTRTGRAKEALRNAESWLREGLRTLGAGAKTSAGYGYFVE